MDSSVGEQKVNSPSIESNQTTNETIWHSQSAEETLIAFSSNREKGLREEEVVNRRVKYGTNELGKKKKKSIWRMLWEQLKDVMILILFIAAGVSFGFEEYAEGAVILVIIVINAIIGIVQEKKAEDALDALNTLSAPNARVLRDGEERVLPATELVPGDIVYLEDGCIVPADVRLIQESNLRIQESALTGESVPVEKDAISLCANDAPLGDRANMAFSSSIVMYGTGVGVVTETGRNTQVGKIAGMLEGQGELVTPMKKKLNSVGKILSLVGIVVALLMFGVGMIYDASKWQTLIISAIALAISVIPEGLPATATVVMALGVQRMAKQQALVRSLPAVETLGSATVICCDKTGTLTLNRMTVTRFATASSIASGGVAIEECGGLDSEKRALVYAGVLCNNAEKDPDRDGETLGDPTEGALLYFADKFAVNYKKLKEQYPRVFEQPFDSDRKRMSVANREGENYLISTKGAIDELLPLCESILEGEKVRPITAQDKENILAFNNEMSSNALRVLGYAQKRVTLLPQEGDDVETGLTLVGVTCMIDPPRKEVIQAVASCHTAGIRVVMITGDHKTTAVAIARQLGIWQEGNTVVSGTELNAMTEEELDAVVGTTTVFARVSPADKLRIVKALQRQKEVVAMTGDGVNDSPALKAANIGVAMGAGTDVAKNASSMVLMDNNFTTIESAVREGRRVYNNIQKVIQFLLAGNVAEILVLFLATLFNWQAPILAVHILLINLATDTLPALALGVDPAGKDIMQRSPVKTGTMFERGLVLRVVLHGLLIAAITLAAYFIGLKVYGGYEVAMTMSFAVLAGSQLVHGANQRSNVQSAFSRGNGHNKQLIMALLGSAAILLFVLFVPYVRDFFKFVILGWEEYLIILALAVVPLIAVEIAKLIQRAVEKRKSK